MLSIRRATTTDIPLLQRLTRIIWPVTYGPIITREQIEYMLETIYGSDSLRKQMEELKHVFLICFDGKTPVGFASYSEVGERIFKLHKIYVLPDHQGKGIGRFALDHIVNEILGQNAVALDLNVNRYNPALGFYERLGFSVIRSEDIDIGNGYWMNDYVMRMKFSHAEPGK